MCPPTQLISRFLVRNLRLHDINTYFSYVFHCILFRSWHTHTHPQHMNPNAFTPNHIITYLPPYFLSSCTSSTSPTSRALHSFLSCCTQYGISVSITPVALGWTASLNSGFHHPRNQWNRGYP